jgi:anti-anti-sigma regulatory factor
VRTAAPGTLRAHREDRKITFQIEGPGTFVLGPALAQAAREALDSGVRTVCVDLRRCTHLDSTLIGTLLRLRQSGDLVLVSPSAECCRILRDMALDTILSMITEEELPRAASLEIQLPPRDALGRVVLEAHEALAELGGSMGPTFRELAEALARRRGEKRP